MKNAVSYSEFARQRGVSQPMVSKYVKMGAITKRSLVRVGKRYKIIPSLANEDLEKNLDPNFTKCQRSPMVTIECDQNQRVKVNGIDFSDVYFATTAENVAEKLTRAIRTIMFISMGLVPDYRELVFMALNEIALIYGSGVENLTGVIFEDED